MEKQTSIFAATSKVATLSTATAVSLLTMSSLAMVPMATVSPMAITTWREEEEEEKKGKVKSHFSKQVGVVLERENKFFLRRKEGNSKLLGGEVGWVG